MKKIMIIFLVCLLAVFCGCGKKDDVPVVSVPSGDEIHENEVPENPETPDKVDGEKDNNVSELLLPDGVSVYGFDISKLTPEAAFNKVTEGVKNYTLDLSIDGKTVTLSAADLNLNCDEAALKNYISAAVENGSAEGLAAPGISFDTTGAKKILHSTFDTAPKNAFISYSTSGTMFTLQPEVNGKEIVTDSAAAAIADAVSTLQTTASASAKYNTVEPEIRQSSEKAKAALDSANKLLSVDLRYTYTPDGGTTSTETMSKATIGSLLYVKSDGLSVGISNSALNSYVSKMSSAHSVPSEKGKFKTTGGGYLDIEVTYGGQDVDTNGLYNDIANCISKGISGTRTAPYLEKSASSNYAYGGSYVEIDLNSQHIWVYKNGDCVVSSPIVSGSVVDKNMTPTGVYSIQKKATNTYLVGPTWRDWVYYWMPFYGGYGMHDADGWRTEYGGDIYLYNGSHGCVNMPQSAARDTYNNVSVGTKVVLYGGAQSVNLTTQEISGTTSYTVAQGSDAFALDASVKYPGCTVSYSSSDENVASVDNSGKVTVKGVGSCNITVEASPYGQYSSASMNITVSVLPYCTLNGHVYGDAEVVHAPTCTSSGESIRHCTVCGAESEPIITPSTGHSFSSDSEYCKNGCGEPNPDYTAPIEPPVDPPTEPPTEPSPEPPADPED